MTLQVVDKHVCAHHHSNLCIFRIRRVTLRNRNLNHVPFLAFRRAVQDLCAPLTHSQSVVRSLSEAQTFFPCTTFCPTRPYIVQQLCAWVVWCVDVHAALLSKRSPRFDHPASLRGHSWRKGFQFLPCSVPYSPDVCSEVVVVGSFGLLHICSVAV